MKRIIQLLTITVLLAGLTISAARYTSKNAEMALPMEEAKEILKQADFKRGGHVPGITWNLTVRNFEGEKMRNEIGIELKAASTEDHLYSLAEFKEPRKYEGQRLLVRDNNMWFMKPGLRSPIAISNRQRLSGTASNADIASPNYYYNYSIESSEKVSLDGKDCYKFSLLAVDNLVSYPKLVYWVTVDSGHGMKTEYYGKSGRLLKYATFAYDNVVNYDGKNYDFISKVLIKDEVNVEDRTVLELESIKFPEINYGIFQKSSLLD